MHTIAKLECVTTGKEIADCPISLVYQVFIFASGQTMPRYSPTEQHPDDNSSVSSRSTGSWWSMASIPGRFMNQFRYDPNNQQPDDNSSLGSRLSGSMRSLAISVTSIPGRVNRWIRSALNNQQPDDNSSIELSSIRSQASLTSVNSTVRDHRNQPDDRNEETPLLSPDSDSESSSVRLSDQETDGESSLLSTNNVYNSSLSTSQQNQQPQNRLGNRLMLQSIILNPLGFVFRASFVLKVGLAQVDYLRTNNIAVLCMWRVVPLLIVDSYRFKAIHNLYKLRGRASLPRIKVHIATMTVGHIALLLIDTLITIMSFSSPENLDSISPSPSPIIYSSNIIFHHICIAVIFLLLMIQTWILLCDSYAVAILLDRLDLPDRRNWSFFVSTTLCGIIGGIFVGCLLDPDINVRYLINFLIPSFSLFVPVYL